MATLNVNIDHVATVRQARRTVEPDPVTAALLCEAAGAAGITCHLREDRRHIQDRDLQILRQVLKTPLNLEMAATDEMIAIALGTRPELVTLVPERREELTTEGGLDVAAHQDRLAGAIRALHDGDIRVSLFVSPDLEQIEIARDAGADAVEINTGVYANARRPEARREAYRACLEAADRIRALGMGLHGGHGLTYQNVAPIAAIDGMAELFIGHSIISHAVLFGLQAAVREMNRLIERATLFPQHHRLD